MTDSLYHIARSGLSLCANHHSTFIDASQCFAEVACSADKGNTELTLVHMVNIVSR